MSTAVLDNLRAERDQARDAAIALASTEDFDPTSEAYTELQTRAERLDGQIANLVGLFEAQTTADALDGRLAKAARSKTDEAPQTRESMGETFVRSEVFRTYPGRGTSSRVEVEARALPMTMTGWADSLPRPQQIMLQDPEAPAIILPLVTSIPVAGNSVDYISWAKTAGGADVVEEGEAKPSAEWAPSSNSASLDNIAVYTQMTRQLMEDATAVRALIDTELRREVARKEEAEAVAAVAAATLATATGPVGAGVLGAIRAGIAAVQATGYSANAFLAHPDDLIDLDILSWNNARGASPFWGLTPVPDDTQTAGTVIVGDFRAGIHRYFRSAISLYVTDSHADTFLSNVFTLLAERRSKTVVVRPGALVEASAGAEVAP